jgi:3'(2'), 5'-bisphosphate nucleotidase
LNLIIESREAENLKYNLPDSLKMPEELNVAITAALEASQRILQIYESGDFGVEEGQKLTTKADRDANAIILSHLKQFSYPILSEEMKDNRNRLNHSTIWIVDPLDGTKEFVNKIPEFTVNIALVHQAEPMIGVVCVPATGELYYAVKGQGSFQVNEEKKQIKVSNVVSLSEMKIAISRFHSDAQFNKLISQIGFKQTLAMGSSLKGILVAKGEADCYIRIGPINEWDICAMDVILREAGGKVSDLKGKNIYYNKRTTLFEKGLLMTNGRAHESLLQALGI